MTHTFEKDYWERHWRDASRQESIPPHPYLIHEIADLFPGTALDAGCGTGAEAIWLAAQGWQVTGADLSTAALAEASERAAAEGVTHRISWVEADLTTWEPETPFDLVTTFYAHPTIPQLDFYRRIAGWVAPDGTLLIVGHLHDETSPPDHEHPPAKATATRSTIGDILDPALWRIDSAGEQTRTRARHPDHAIELRDVAVRATRLKEQTRDV